jgi:hypothetical protein
MTTDPKWLAVAALVGAGAAALVLKVQQDAGRSDAAPAAAQAPATATPPVTPAPVTAPVPAVAPPVAQAAPARVSPPGPPLPVPPASSGDPALDGSLARAQLDDRQLAQHAREHYGFDCPAIVDRAAPRSGRYLITCSNGTRLRVHLEPGLPRITLP